MTALPTSGHQATVPFIGFAEAFVVKALRRAGMRDSRIRERVQAVRDRWGVDHALASGRLRTDRAELLWGDEGEDLEVVHTLQQQMSATVANQISLITYGSDDYAKRIQLPQFQRAQVFVDPEVAFGYPLIEPEGVRVQDVLDRFWAGELMSDIAGDYELSVEVVEEVIRAQTRPPERIAASG